MQTPPVANARIHAAIAAASARTGVDFGFLLREAEVESGLNPSAKAATSSARGLFQFTDATWLAAIRRHGATAGLGWAAEALKGGDSRAAILALRDDPESSALLAAHHTADNAARIANGTGRTPGPVDLYLGHFLGAGGAIRFLNALADDGAQSAAALFPSAAAANPGVFGAGTSLADIYRRFAEKFGGAAASPTPSARPATGAARLAYLMLAALGG